MSIKTQHLQGERRKTKLDKPLCPICAKEMTKKGKTVKDRRFKCKRCGGTYVDGQFREKMSDIQRMEYGRELMIVRKKAKLTRMIKRLKKEKYLPYKSFEWDGKVINLDDYDKDGISKREKEELEGIAKEEKKKDLAPEVDSHVVQ